MPDRLDIINDALIATGSEPLTVEWDGSDEWIAAESAYRRAVGFLLERHAWPFTTTSADLVLLPTSPTPKYEFAFALPSDCLFLKAVFINDVALADYELVNDSVCCRFDSGITATYVRQPPNATWPAGFVEALTLRMEAAIIRALNEPESDSGARARLQEAEAILEQVRTRSDQQSPGRPAFVSRVVSRRRGVLIRGA